MSCEALYHCIGGIEFPVLMVGTARWELLMRFFNPAEVLRRIYIYILQLIQAIYTSCWLHRNSSKPSEEITLLPSCRAVANLSRHQNMADAQLEVDGRAVVKELTSLQARHTRLIDVRVSHLKVLRTQPNQQPCFPPEQLLL